MSARGGNALVAFLESKATETVSRHRVTVGVLVGGWLGAGLLSVYTPIVFSWSGGFLFGFLAVMVRWVVRAGWWMNRRAVQLASMSLPAPPLWHPLKPSLWRQWRQHRARVKYTRLQWERFCLSHKITGIGGVVPKLHGMRQDPQLDLSASISPGPLSVKGGVDRIVQLRMDLAETVGCEEVLVSHAGVGQAKVTFLWTQQFERPIPISDADYSHADRMLVPVGKRRDGSSAFVKLPQSALVVGMKGSGKSGFTWSFLCGLTALKIPHWLWLSDPKNGIELGAYQQYAGEAPGPGVYREVKGYADDVDGTVVLIEKFLEAIVDRGAKTGTREWTVRDADEFPLGVLVFDESVEVMDELMKAPANTTAGKRAREAYRKLKKIESQGRAMGFMVLYLSQLAQKDILGTIRDMAPYQFCLKTKNRINTEMVLGEGAEQQGAPCSKIGDIPGYGFSAHETQRGFQPFRVTYCDQDAVEAIAAGGLPDGVGKDHAAGEVNRQCAVYRFFDRHAQLLYVGITVNLQARWKQHADSKPWWAEVDMSKTLVTWHANTDAARSVEETEIKTRFPRYNLQHNGDNPIRGGSPVLVEPVRRFRRKHLPQVELTALEFFDQESAPVLYPSDSGRRGRSSSAAGSLR